MLQPRLIAAVVASASSDAHFSPSAPKPGQSRAVPGAGVRVPAGALCSGLWQQMLLRTWGPSAKGGQSQLWGEVRYKLLDWRGRK